MSVEADDVRPGVGPQGTFRIGQLAAEVGVNPNTLRFYEHVGLLPSLRRAGNGYRMYSEADRDRLRFIQKAKGVGLSLTEIEEILALGRQGLPPCVHVEALLDQKIAAIDQQLESLAEMRRELVCLRDVAREGPAWLVCGIIEASKTAMGPQEHRSLTRAGRGRAEHSRAARPGRGTRPTP